MAWIRCSQCGRQVSSNAYSCPNCGQDIRALRDSGASCSNCTRRGDSDMGWCENSHPNNYPCLGWQYDEPDTDW